MYWCIEKTTCNERTTISNAMSPLFSDLERAEALLDTVMEDCFDGREQKPLDSCDAAWVGTMLRVARDIIADTIVAYHLTVADTDDVRAKNYIAAAEAVKTAMQCEDAFRGSFAAEQELPAEERKAFCEARCKAGDMEDAAAIVAVDNLMRGRE